MGLQKEAYIKIYTENIRYNYRIIKEYVGNQEVIPVIKGDAYGHGAVINSKILEDEGVETFCVGNISEAIELRNNNVCSKIIVLSPPNNSNIEYFSHYGIKPIVYSVEHLTCITNYDKHIPFEVEIDTGMGRSGCNIDEFNMMMKLIRKENLKIDGVFSHLFNSTDYSTSKEQLSKLINACGNYDEISVHLASSAGISLGKEFCSIGIRPGLAIYGLAELPSTGIKLKPALEYISSVSEIVKRKKGERVGYNAMGATLERDSVIGLINIGYTHGYPRLPNTCVLHKNTPAKVLGGVNMMNMCIDLTDCSNPRKGDEIVILSIDPKSEASVLNLAKQNASIPNLFVCNINGNYVEREFV